jgi:LPXTG-motif cell wall-anchored protein
MDFIEQLFGFSPDGGDGSLEFLWLAAALVAVGAFIFRRRIRTNLAARAVARRR